MHFKVVFRAAKALQEAGYACLRFNFRGVGASQGVHDEGRGEQDDVRTALDELRRRFPGLPLILGGFSFGAAMAYRVGVREKDLKALFVMGLPVSSIERAHRPEGLPLLIVQGEQDRFGSGAEVQAFVETLAPPVTVKIVLGSDHFFSGQEMALQGILADWFRSLP